MILNSSSITAYRFITKLIQLLNRQNKTRVKDPVFQGSLREFYFLYDKFFSPTRRRYI